ncbi:hypothetical protein JTE90_010939 [Oedothorax gibbosus]|uniref:Uncharacterized protein n=1 Tax=Oedothorax gibbosus TaxID=931172 RepID=A0AAV6UC23_9ARAC|nr:hypothetical protein JTE90_010939 [Oedothorax gibbosus]
MKFTNSSRKNIIVISSSLIYCIIFGIIRLNSQLFVVVRVKFGADREQPSFPFTLQYAVRNLSGPFIGFIGNKFGWRCTTVFGCLLSSVSLAACFLAKDIIYFTVLWGIAFGIGEYLLLTYGTFGTFLILSGFVLHSIPLAMLLECPETIPKIESHLEVQEKGEIFKI